MIPPLPTEGDVSETIAKLRLLALREDADTGVAWIATEAGTLISRLWEAHKRDGEFHVSRARVHLSAMQARAERAEAKLKEARTLFLAAQIFMDMNPLSPGFHTAETIVRDINCWLSQQDTSA